MNHDYLFVLLEGNINRIIDYINPVKLNNYSSLRIRTKPKAKYTHMYHAIDKEKLMKIWVEKPNQIQLYHVINLTKEEEDKILALLVLGLELFNILKDMYGVFPLNGYVDE